MERDQFLIAFRLILWLLWKERNLRSFEDKSINLTSFLGDSFVIMVCGWSLWTGRCYEIVSFGWGFLYLGLYVVSSLLCGVCRM